MAEISDYTDAQQKVIKEIVKSDNGFHSSYLIAESPLYDMLEENDEGTTQIKKDISVPLSTGSSEYNLHVWYSQEQSCWFFSLSFQSEEFRGIVHYNTVYNAKGFFSLVILNDNLDGDISLSLPYSNILILRK